MSTDGVNVVRRRLIITTAAIGGVGVVAAALPFVYSWNPSAKARAAGASVTADISQIEIGQRLVVEWRGKPVWVVRRTPAMLAGLSKHDGDLKDPSSSEESQQPDYARNPTRSIKPEFLILTGICTHLGCSPNFRPEVGAADLGSSWPGGFFCPCHGSRFDLAGRVFNGVPAPTNLVVPPHMYLSAGVIVIGSDKEHPNG